MNTDKIYVSVNTGTSICEAQAAILVHSRPLFYNRYDVLRRGGGLVERTPTLTNYKILSGHEVYVCGLCVVWILALTGSLCDLLFVVRQVSLSRSAYLSVHHLLNGDTKTPHTRAFATLLHPQNHTHARAHTHNARIRTGVLAGKEMHTHSSF